jgi:hypothetical protein
MKLLTETMDLDELNGVRMLLESNGIPVFVGNEDTARNMGFMLPARRYGIFVLYDEQFHDAQCLLSDETHIVHNKIDIDEFRKNMELVKPNALAELVQWVLITAAVFAVFFVVLVWIIERFA